MQRKRAITDLGEGLGAHLRVGTAPGGDRGISGGLQDALSVTASLQKPECQLQLPLESKETPLMTPGHLLGPRAISWLHPKPQRTLLGYREPLGPAGIHTRESRKVRLSELEGTSGTTRSSFPICVDTAQAQRAGKGLGKQMAVELGPVSPGFIQMVPLYLLSEDASIYILI